LRQVPSVSDGNRSEHWIACHSEVKMGDPPKRAAQEVA
jgi:hypothetical protein